MDEFSFYFTEEYARYDILNMLIKKYGFKTYLEIGVAEGDTFRQIVCEEKTSVDPLQRGATTCQMTSDEFFASLPPDRKFDIIFVDGLHIYEQCYTDIENSVRHLSDNGFVLCHDMNPINKWVCRRFPAEGETGPWTGDVYKAFVKFRCNYLNYSCCLLYDCDWGVGVIRKGIGRKIICDADNLAYDDFANNKNYLMNCISVYDFVKHFC